MTNEDTDAGRMDTSTPMKAHTPTTSRLGGRKVFCVGFNKTGTTTLHRIFADQLGLRSTHNPRWTDWSVAGMKEPLERHQCFSDGGCASIRNLDRLYPDALFILNTRPLKNWVLSRHKAVERSRTATRWVLTRYAPLGWLASLLNRVVMNHSPRAMARWVAIRNSYHRHVMEYFQGREDRLLLLDIENPDAYERLTRFLDTHQPVEPPKANADGKGSTTRIILDAIGAKVGKDVSGDAVTSFFRDAGIEDQADCLTWFESDTLRLKRSASDLVLTVLPFLRAPVRWLYRFAARHRSSARSFFAKWMWDHVIRLCRSERDMHHFTTVTRNASGSR